MRTGQYVTRGDGSTWQIVEVLNAIVNHRYNGLPGVMVTEYHLTRGGEHDYVRQWGAQQSKDIGREPDEILVLDPNEKIEHERARGQHDVE